MIGRWLKRLWVWRGEEPEPELDRLLVEGWLQWYNPYASLGTRPHDFRRVWIMRPEWLQPVLVDPNSLNPMMNVMGLYWVAAADEQPSIDRDTTIGAEYRVH